MAARKKKKRTAKKIAKKRPTRKTSASKKTAKKNRARSDPANRKSVRKKKKKTKTSPGRKPGDDGFKFTRLTHGIALPHANDLALMPSSLPPLSAALGDNVWMKDVSPEETLRRQQKFVEAMSGSGNVRASCICAGIPRGLALAWRKNNKEFSDAWDEAYEMAVDSLEQEAWRRARDGTDHPVIYQGEITDTYKEYSDSLMTFLLRGHRSEKPEHPGATFKDKTEVSGSLARPQTLDKETKEDVAASILAMIDSKKDPT